MLRYEITSVGRKRFRSYGKFTVKPTAKSDELEEAHIQTLNGQWIARGFGRMDIKPEDTERPEYKTS